MSRERTVKDLQKSGELLLKKLHNSLAPGKQYIQRVSQKFSTALRWTQKTPCENWKTEHNPTEDLICPVTVNTSQESRARLFLSVCVCGSPTVWETWQRGLFFKVWLYQCVFSVHSSHSCWKPADQWELTSYISATTVCLKSSGRRRSCVADSVFTWLYAYMSVCVWHSVSLIAVIVVFVVTAQSCETSQADSIREKYLGTSIHPYLQKQRETESERRKWKDMLAHKLISNYWYTLSALAAVFGLKVHRTRCSILHSLQVTWHKLG